MRIPSLLSAFALYSVGVVAHALPRDSDTSVQVACQQLQAQLSKTSAVFLPGSTSFEADVEHYFNSSSAQATCSVEPGSAADVSKILQVVAKNRTPFAVKGAGHSGNPGFSSTSGIQIAMTRFNETVYHANNGTVDIGTGLPWDAVYSYLEQFNITVAGGRITGVGVAGFSLGGGLNYFGNQVGFSVDNIVRVQVVLPSGQLVTASAQINPDLFFGVKGAYNNFGIVTQITYKAISIPNQVWGGLKLVAGDQVEAVTNATLKYIAEVNDPKASLVTQYTGIPGQALPEAVISTFYNGPAPPPGIFDDFIAIPAISDTTSGPRSMVSLVQDGGEISASARGNYNSAPVEKATPALINAVINETIFLAQKLANTSTVSVAIAIEAFLPSIFQQAAAGSSAYPPNRSNPFVPIGITFNWNNASDDKLIAEANTQAALQIARAAASEGQDVDTVPIYGNYASPISWSAQRIFGASLPKLQTIKKKYDPDNVMGLTGGWKVTS